jgi:lipoate-protein ligase A
MFYNNRNGRSVESRLSMRQWRLIYDSPAAGADNMAIDEAILTTVSAGASAPTLRVYGWEPLCLSLGYGQRAGDADLDRLAANGWGIVRRPTGGRAILHGDELTYSVSLPADDELAQGDVVESYRRISEALMAALQRLGLSPASEKQAKGNRSVGPVCFEVPSHYEITAGGKKLIGSAQVRRKTGILQHGTLPLSGDIARICEALAYPDEAEREAARQLVRDRATTLESVCGQVIDWQTAADALITGFAETFDLELVPGELLSEEIQCADDLKRDVYASDSWTFKR